ncbi:MAG: heavy metal translocating P-type ATPase [Simkaniaceae bacterium]
MKKEFKVHGLDCAEEVQLLRKILEPQKGIKQLEFDVVHAKMTVAYDPKEVDHNKILDWIASTGMKAVLWEERLTEKQGSFWQRRGRLLMTCLSGALLFAGIVGHLVLHGHLLSMLGPYEKQKEMLPIWVIVCYLAAIIAGMWHVLPKALRSVKRLHLDMNVLMVFAVGGSLILREWFEGATVTFLFSLANLLEHWSVARARKAVSELMDLTPTLATVINAEGQRLEKKVEEVKKGEYILVRPGEKIPLDAMVSKGESSVNQAPITGESIPVAKQKGDKVYAGTINEEGALECEVLKEFRDTTLSRIIHMVQEASARRAGAERWVEKFSKIYTPLMIIFALVIMFLPPLFFGLNWMEWVYRGLVILVIACPCALVISTPVSVVSGITSAARNGVLIKGGMYLEAPAYLRALAVDKTGTLTYGKPMVQNIIPLNHYSEKDVLSFAASLEHFSEHPLAKAILARAEEENAPVLSVENYQAIKGKGAIGRIEGKQFWIGSHRFMHEKKQEDPKIHQMAVEIEDSGHSLIAIGNDSHIIGLISVSDSPRELAKETLQTIKEQGVEKIIMLTGDNVNTAGALAKETGVDAYYAELLPEDKVEAVKTLVEKYEHVCMVGDGINDAPAMAMASFGIAMGAIGADAAIETADIALMTDDLSKIPWLIRLSKKTLKIIKQNIVFALSLKILFIALALLGWASLWMAIAADTGASLLVIFNALRLLKNLP